MVYVRIHIVKEMIVNAPIPTYTYLRTYIYICTRYICIYASRRGGKEFKTPGCGWLGSTPVSTEACIIGAGCTHVADYELLRTSG